MGLSSGVSMEMGLSLGEDATLLQLALGCQKDSWLLNREFYTASPTNATQDEERGPSSWVAFVGDAV
jgi:hypothetical protein